jgi:hypothetical protein
MTRPAAANGAPRTPRDFAVLLPPGWVRIKLDGSEPVVLARLVAAKVATVPAQREARARARSAARCATPGPRAVLTC